MVKRRIIGKSSAFDSFLYSSINVKTITEQMLQIDDMFKQLMNVHQKYNSLLPLEAQEDDEKWFDDIGADMLVFKQIHNWIREAEHDRDAELKEKASVKSKRSSKSSSEYSSSRSSSRRSSRSESALMEKIKMTELKAQAELTENRQSAEFKAQKLKIEDQYAKQR